jgi:hypothetical protein
MIHRGKLLIIGILVLAASAAVFSIWYLRGLSRRSYQYFGTEAAELILQAPVVEASRPADGAPQQRRDISQARGLINVRRGLVSDASYDWDPGEISTSPRWDYSLHFRDGPREATLLVSLADRQIMLGGDRLLFTRSVAEGLRHFFAEQFVEGEPAAR